MNEGVRRIKNLDDLDGVSEGDWAFFLDKEVPERIFYLGNRLDKTHQMWVGPDSSGDICIDTVRRIGNFIEVSLYNTSGDEINYRAYMGITSEGYIPDDGRGLKSYSELDEFLNDENAIKSEDERS